MTIPDLTWLPAIWVARFTRSLGACGGSAWLEGTPAEGVGSSPIIRPGLYSLDCLGQGHEWERAGSRGPEHDAHGTVLMPPVNDATRAVA
ncbi:hypothetical protein F4775DRAFT_587639 [Biscogniauxia sp. FL1348]|nr:hypothetical protein F4775DRAFT_587639 [Biscogniauxia sp. FL1348]